MNREIDTQDESLWSEERMKVGEVQSRLMGRMSLRDFISNYLDFIEIRGTVVYKEK